MVSKLNFDSTFLENSFSYNLERRLVMQFIILQVASNSSQGRMRRLHRHSRRLPSTGEPLHIFRVRVLVGLCHGDKWSVALKFQPVPEPHGKAGKFRTVGDVSACSDSHGLGWHSRMDISGILQGIHQLPGQPLIYLEKCSTPWLLVWQTSSVSDASDGLSTVLIIFNRCWNPHRKEPNIKVIYRGTHQRALWSSVWLLCSTGGTRDGWMRENCLWKEIAWLGMWRTCLFGEPLSSWMDSTSLWRAGQNTNSPAYLSHATC